MQARKQRLPAQVRRCFHSAAATSLAPHLVCICIDNESVQVQVGARATTPPTAAMHYEEHASLPPTAGGAAGNAPVPTVGPPPSWSSLAMVAFYEPLSSTDDEEGLSDLEETVMGRGFEAAAWRTVDADASELS